MSDCIARNVPVDHGLFFAKKMFKAHVRTLSRYLDGINIEETKEEGVYHIKIPEHLTQDNIRKERLKGVNKNV